MSLSETHSRVKARVWQAVAQSDIDVSGLDKETLETLVDLVTEAALLELDDEMDKSLAVTRPKSPSATTEGDEENVLWEGRPFLSLSLHYAITNERIRITEGLLGKARENVELVRVQDVDYNQTIGDRLLNLGDITVRSHDPSDPVVELKNIKDPETVQEILRRAVLEARKKHNLIYREEM